ncbi:MAG: cysteine hydrolase family protein [Ginsengibacter sp.]
MTIHRFAFQILILVLFLSGCKSKTENNDSVNSVDTGKTLTNRKEKQRTIQIKAKPDSVAIDVSKTAVIVVDMENDFCSKDGLMDRVGAKISVVQDIIEPTKRFLTAARNAGIPIIYLKMGFKPDLSDLGANELDIRQRFYSIVGDTINAPDGTIGRLLIRNTWNTEIIPELEPNASDIVLYKTRFSGFYQTKLDSTLKSMGIKNLIVIGCTTSVCIESTVRDAMFRDYLPVVLEDCTAEPDGLNFSRTNHDASLFIIQTEFGWVSNSVEFIKAFKEQTVSDTESSR